MIGNPAYLLIWPGSGDGSGAPGKSAYQIWLENGHTGTEADFLKSLEGPGGYSAYEIWLLNGNSGTEQEYLASLQGGDGKSAYRTWLDLGNEGSEAEFIESLEGPPGPEFVLDEVDGGIWEQHG